MTKRKFNSIFILVIFALYVAYYRLFLSRIETSMVEFINVAIVIVLSFISVMLLGFRKDKPTILKKAILGTTLSEILIFIAISYGLGFITGYLENSYALDPLSIFENVLTPILYVIGIEIFRYTISNANKERKEIVYVTTFLITLLELSIGLQNVIMYNFETTFTTTSSIILPIIIKNITMSYLTIHGGLRPVLLYRLVMDIYGYVIPIVPDLGDYLTSVIGILLPATVYMYSAILVDNSYKESEEKFTKKNYRLSDIPAMIFIVVLVGLISGRFKYVILGVGSESMSPKINKGDSVIYQKVNSLNDIEVGDVIVFKSGSKMIIHRYIEKKEEEDKIYLRTKGDANNSADNLNITFDDVEGKVLFKIKYLSYPSIWLKEIVENSR